MYTTYGTENFSSDLFYSLNFKWTFRQNMIGIVYGTTCNISPTACSPNAKLRWLSNLLREARWQEIKMTVRIFFRTSESNARIKKSNEESSRKCTFAYMLSFFSWSMQLFTEQYLSYRCTPFSRLFVLFTATPIWSFVSSHVPVCYRINLHGVHLQNELCFYSHPQNTVLIEYFLAIDRNSFVIHIDRKFVRFLCTPLQMRR